MLTEFNEICPLCKSQSLPFYKDEFLICRQCKGVFRASNYLLNPIEEKKRYEKHNNDVFDKRYQNFVSPITNAVQRDFDTSSVGLDFGAGPGPVISKVLNEKGYTIRQYDPFFSDNPEVLNSTYDYIVCCEVMEHFHRPEKEFILLRSILKPGGRLYCMTHLYSPDVDFGNWYYKNDITHVFLYQHKTLEWIKNNFSFSQFTVNERLIVFSLD